MRPLIAFTLINLLFLVGGCASSYYSAMEKIGIHKRDILVDRVEAAKESQQEGQQQFKNALEQYRSVVQFDGGEVAKAYDLLNDEHENSVAAAEEISGRIAAIESVADAMFDEWADELKQYSNARLRKDSQNKLNATKKRYGQLISHMRKTEKSMEPILATLKDQVLYLKHNLNAQAIASLRGEFGDISQDINQLITRMDSSIKEADAFIATLQ